YQCACTPHPKSRSTNSPPAILLVCDSARPCRVLTTASWSPALFARRHESDARPSSVCRSPGWPSHRLPQAYADQHLQPNVAREPTPPLPSLAPSVRCKTGPACRPEILLALPTHTARRLPIPTATPPAH